MTITAIRQKLQDYIKTADDKKIKAIFTLVENDIDKEAEWWVNKEFVAELNERVDNCINGIEKGYTIDEIDTEIENRKYVSE